MSVDECFHHFRKYRGIVPEGYSVNFLGGRARNAYTATEIRPPFGYGTGYPAASEEYFEWVDLLESVLLAREEFIFMELGAGYGRWSVNAALAAEQQGKRYRILAVEPEPTHFAWMKENFEDNGLDLDRCELVEAAVATKRGEAEFYVGNPAKWYGQAIRESYRPELTQDMEREGVRFESVKTVTLNEYLEKYGEADLIDMDVQSLEYDILLASKSLLNSNVRRVHIGTHGHEIEQKLRKMFKTLGWISKYDFECLGESGTPIGPISFQDGIQSWVNPSL